MRAADVLYAGFGKPEMPNLAFLDQLLDRPGNIFDRHVGVDPVLVQQVDMSVRRRFSEPSTAVRICCQLLSIAPPPWMSRPNLVAMTTRSRMGSSASPTTSSFLYGP